MFCFLHSNGSKFLNRRYHTVVIHFLILLFILSIDYDLNALVLNAYTLQPKNSIRPNESKKLKRYSGNLFLFFITEHIYFDRKALKTIILYYQHRRHTIYSINDFARSIESGFL